MLKTGGNECSQLERRTRDWSFTSTVTKVSLAIMAIMSQYERQHLSQQD